MSAPFTFITTHAINDGKLDQWREQTSENLEFIEANEPRLRDFQVSISEDQSEVTFVYAFADADAADVHLQTMQAQIGRGLEITTTARLEVHGTPGPMLEQVLNANAARGVAVSVKPTHLGGFSRSATSREGVT